MNYDQHIKALNATIRALDEEYEAETRAKVSYYEAQGDQALARIYRASLARIEAEPGPWGEPQAA